MIFSSQRCSCLATASYVKAYLSLSIFCICLFASHKNLFIYLWLNPHVTFSHNAFLPFSLSQSLLAQNPFIPIVPTPHSWPPQEKGKKKTMCPDAPAPSSERTSSHHRCTKPLRDSLTLTMTMLEFNCPNSAARGMVIEKCSSLLPPVTKARAAHVYIQSFPVHLTHLLPSITYTSTIFFLSTSHTLTHTQAFSPLQSKSDQPSPFHTQTPSRKKEARKKESIATMQAMQQVFTSNMQPIQTYSNYPRYARSETKPVIRARQIIDHGIISEHPCSTCVELGENCYRWEGTFSKCAYCTSKDRRKDMCHLPGQEVRVEAVAERRKRRKM